MRLILRFFFCFSQKNCLKALDLPSLGQVFRPKFSRVSVFYYWEHLNSTWLPFGHQWLPKPFKCFHSWNMNFAETQKSLGKQKLFSHMVFNVHINDLSPSIFGLLSLYFFNLLRTRLPNIRTTETGTGTTWSHWSVFVLVIFHQWNVVVDVSSSCSFHRLFYRSVCHFGSSTKCNFMVGFLFVG